MRVAAWPPQPLCRSFQVGLLVVLSLILRTRPEVLLLVSPTLLSNAPSYSSPRRLAFQLWIIHQVTRCAGSRSCPPLRNQESPAAVCAASEQGSLVGRLSVQSMCTARALLVEPHLARSAPNRPAGRTWRWL